MTVIEHVREILAASISEPLADVGICLTDDRSGYTIARYEGRDGDFDRSVTVVRDKWWSKSRGRFAIFLNVENHTDGELNVNAPEIPLGDLMDRDSSEWQIWATDDAAPFINEIRDGMLIYGTPWMVRVSDPAGYARWQKEQGY